MTQWVKPPQETGMSDYVDEDLDRHYSSDPVIMNTTYISPSKTYTTRLSSRVTRPIINESRNRKISINLPANFRGDLVNSGAYTIRQPTPRGKRVRQEEVITTPVAKKVRVGGPISLGIMIGHSPSPYPESERGYSPQ
jgi:hypothetical protein